MALIALVAFGTFVCVKGKRRPSLLIIGVLATGGLALSSSRGGYLAFGLGISYLVYKVRSRQTVAGIIAICFCFTALVAAVPTVRTFTVETVASIGDLWHGTDKSAADRQELWSKNFAIRSVSGLGYGGNAEVSNVDISDSVARAKAYSAQTIDSSWLKLLVEEGLIGVGLFALIVMSAARRVLQRGRSGPSASPVAAILGMVGVAFFFRSLSVDMLDINPWNWVLWLLIGLALSQVVSEDLPLENPPDERIGSRPLATMTTLVGQSESVGRADWRDVRPWAESRQ